MVCYQRIIELTKNTRRVVFLFNDTGYFIGINLISVEMRVLYQECSVYVRSFN